MYPLYLIGLISSGLLVNTAHLLGAGASDSFDANDDEMDADESRAGATKTHIGVITSADGTQEYIHVIPISESKKDIRESLEGLSARMTREAEEEEKEELRVKEDKEKTSTKRRKKVVSRIDCLPTGAPLPSAPLPTPVSSTPGSRRSSSSSSSGRSDSEVRRRMKTAKTSMGRNTGIVVSGASSFRSRRQSTPAKDRFPRRSGSNTSSSQTSTASAPALETGAESIVGAKV